MESGLKFVGLKLGFTSSNCDFQNKFRYVSSKEGSGQKLQDGDFTGLFTLEKHIGSEIIKGVSLKTQLAEQRVGPVLILKYGS